jgi:hypothetical protein
VLYQEVYDANRRLCSRLGVDEDRDIENLISNMQEIAKILAMKMFDYGMQFQNDPAQEIDSVAGYMKET